MKPRERRAVIAQLMAHRDTLLAAATQTEATLILLGVDPEQLGQPTADGPGDGCPHPLDQIADASTLGQDEYTCRACGESFDHHPHHPKE